MPKTATIHMRVEPELKQDVENILRELGLTTSEAINMFLRQVSARRGIPFDVRIPNAETREAMEELKMPRNLKSYDSFEALLEEVKDDA
jgi:DNA-damage-inducible protein J